MSCKLKVVVSLLRIIATLLSLRPFSTRFILGGSPYPGKDAKKMAKLLERGYRMPKPQHVDEKLYEKIVLLLLFSLYVLIAVTFI